MTFSSKQISALRTDVDPAFTRLRKLNDGRELPYIEGWYAIAEANRIFGFDAWSRETVDVKCLQAREVRGSFQVLYLAKVRVTVRAGDHETIREGYGTGAAASDSLGDAHEKALKSAETDATKRALATFGRPFGLALHVPATEVDAKPTAPQPAIPDVHRRRTRQRKDPDGRFRLVRDPRLNLMQKEFLIGTNAASISAASSDQERPPNTESEFGTPAVDQQPAEQVVVPITKTLRRRSLPHLRYVMAQPCLLCARTPSDAHHLRFTQPRAMGRKVSDEYTVPLCRTHHRQLHHSGDEVGWWMAMEIDPLPIAQDLWQESQKVANDVQSKTS
jgi:DNA recombination protein Rad52